MNYRPIRNRKGAKVICVLLFVAAALCAVCSSLEILWKPMWQILMLGCIVAVIEITVRYIMSDYEYILDPDDELLQHNRITVIYIQGKKRCSVAEMSLYDLVEIKKHQKFAVYKEKYGSNIKKYNFSSDLFPRLTYDLIFDDNGEHTLIRLQCDENFVEELKKRAVTAS